MSIKTNFEIPRAVDDNDIVKQGQRTAQDLSKNFKSIKKDSESLQSQIDLIKSNQPITKFIDLTFSFTSGSPLYQVITLAHNLNVIPTGWIVIDVYRTSGLFAQPGFIRTSWDATNITLENMVNMGVVAKIRVFV